MIVVSKTPLRIPLAGGLTDLKQFAAEFGGVTVSATIDKYIYVVLKRSPNQYTDLKYQNVHERVTGFEQIRHSLIREAMRLTGLEETPVELTIMADLPSESGLGSSGALTVGLLNAMHTLQGRSVGKQQLYDEASYIEVDILEGASGYHDPTICAIGGLKLIEYAGPRVTAREIAMSEATYRQFCDSLLFFYSGHHAKSKPSLDLLTSHMLNAHDILHNIKRIAYELEVAFGHGDLGEIGRIIETQQRLKMQLPGKFVNSYVREIVDRIAQLGAHAQLPGGKISAFVIVCCPLGNQAQLRQELAELREVHLTLTHDGTSVITL